MNVREVLTKPVHIAPLVTFRIIFGAVMFASVCRFVLKGWVYDLYIKPTFYFTYYGFDWVKPLGNGMYVLFALMGLAAFCIMIGFLYRYASITFFLAFSYVELIDKTNYLNHYYFISIISFLLIFLPAANYFSVDTLLKPEKTTSKIPLGILGILMAQIGLVYFFAGLAKLNYDWLFRAMPLRIWLPADYDFPLIGTFFDQVWVAYFFSWISAFYDLAIPFLLLNKKTVKPAYGILLIFHAMTYALFNIGMFPFIMMGLTLLFFPESFHIGILSKLQHLFHFRTTPKKIYPDSLYAPRKFLLVLVGIHFFIQILLPLRYILYPGNLFWTEQGYRFSWRVMLMEKGGTNFFHVQDPATGNICEVVPGRYLSPFQAKMMSTQPDMILQFAHYIDKEYRLKGIKDPIVTVESYVTLNGSGSRPFIDPKVDLSKQKESFLPKLWLLPFQE